MRPPKNRRHPVARVPQSGPRLTDRRVVDWRERLRRKRRPLILGVLLVIVTLAVYAQAPRLGFILLDDAVYVSENPRVQAGLTSGNLSWIFAFHEEGNWIPLTWLSLALDAQVFGLHAGGYHVTNVLFHAANAVLLFALLFKMSRLDLRSAFVAALFAVHPLHVESVAWIPERKDVLSIFFGFLSLLSYVNCAQRDRFGGRRWRSLLASLAFLVCSLMSKPTLVTLPFVFLLLDYWPLGRIALRGQAIPTADRPGAEPPQGRPGSAARLLLEKLPFFAVSAAFCVIAVLAQQKSSAVVSLAHVSLFARTMNAIAAYGAYLRQTVAPVGLAIVYAHRGESVDWPAAAGAAALILTISACALIWIRRLPYLFVGWCWYLGTLVPMIGIVQVGNQRMADRYTYFPLIGVFLAVTWLAAELAPHSWTRRILPAAALTCAATLAAASWVQLSYWRDDVSLFQHAVESGEVSATALGALGYALALRGQVRDGIACLESAVQREPQNFEAHYNLGVVLQSQGRLDRAAEQYRAALSIREANPEAHVNLGTILCEQREYARAKPHFLRAVEINPDHLKALANLAQLGLLTGDYRSAIESSRRALAIVPGSPEFLKLLDDARRGAGSANDAGQPRPRGDR